MEKNCDFLVVGGGIVGLTIANELLLRGCKNILILEKERSLGAHSSGRNSGVSPCRDLLYARFSQGAVLH